MLASTEKLMHAICTLLAKHEERSRWAVQRKYWSGLSSLEKKELIKSLERKDNKFATSVIESRKIPGLTILMLPSGALIEAGYTVLV